MDGRRKLLKHAGFTLSELMTALLVLALLTSLALPGFESVIQRTHLALSSARFLEALNLARHEAVQRNLPVSVCPSRLAEDGSPVCSGIYADGWMVFTNADRDKVVDRKEDEVIRAYRGLPEGYRLSNRAGTSDAYSLLNYLPDGTAHQPGTLQFCPPEGSRVRPLNIVINIIGRARLTREEMLCQSATG